MTNLKQANHNRTETTKQLKKGQRKSINAYSPFKDSNTSFYECHDVLYFLIFVYFRIISFNNLLEMDSINLVFVPFLPKK